MLASYKQQGLLSAVNGALWTPRHACCWPWHGGTLPLPQPVVLCRQEALCPAFHSMEPFLPAFALALVQRGLAEKVLMTFRDHADAWTRVDVILEQSKNPNAKYFALQVRGRGSKREPGAFVWEPELLATRGRSCGRELNEG